MNFRPFSSLSSLFSGAPVWRGGPNDIVATLYEDGTIVSVSASAATVIGAAGNLVGRSLFDFVARSDRDDVRAALMRASQSSDDADPGALTASFLLLRVRRAAAQAEITLRPIGHGRLMALIRDRGRAISRRQAGNDGQEAAPVPLAAPRQADPARADLIADLSHEMKTPLNAIMGFADAMRTETFGPLGDPKYADYVDHIHEAGSHLLSLIGAALDQAALDAGRLKLSPSLSAPGPIGSACAAMIRREAEKAGLKFIVNIAPDLPETMIDARIVKQILINLLSNAVKFTEEGEIELSVEEKCGAIDFTVRDTGVGMNAVMLAKLGGRYTDTHKEGVRGAAGSGLGLSLAFNLAKLHGGALNIRSAPGEGTTARLTLPVRRAFDRHSAAACAVSASDVQSQFDRVNAYRRERAASAA